jgi:hypothetical protein
VSASSNAAQITVTGWWLVDPVQPSTSIPLNVVGFPTSIHEQLSTHYPIGQQYPTIVADVVNGTDGQLAVETQSASEWQSLLAASTSQRIKWLMSPYGDGLYVRIGGASPTMGIAGQVHQTQLSPSTPTTPYRQVTLQYVNVGRP